MRVNDDEQEEADSTILNEGELEKALYEENDLNVQAKKFVDENPNYGVEVFELTPFDNITIVEHAPRLFSHIRRGIISDGALMNSLLPSANFSAMHNF